MLEQILPSLLPIYISTSLINSMEQKPSSEGDSHTAGQEIPLVLWNPKFHFRVHLTLS